MILERLVHLLSALLTVNLVRGLAVFAVAYAITTVVGGLSPATRHVIWFAVILSFLLFPLAWLSLPAMQVGVRIPVEPRSAFRLAAAPALSRHDYTHLIDKGLENARLAGQGRGVPADPATHSAGRLALGDWLVDRPLAHGPEQAEAAGGHCPQGQVPPALYRCPGR